MGRSNSNVSKIDAWGKCVGVEAIRTASSIKFPAITGEKAQNVACN